MLQTVNKGRQTCNDRGPAASDSGNSPAVSALFPVCRHLAVSNLPQSGHPFPDNDIMLEYVKLKVTILVLVDLILYDIFYHWLD